MKNMMGQMPTRQVDTAMMEPKAQMTAIRNRRMRLIGNSDSPDLENTSTLASPGKKAKAPDFKDNGMSAEMNYRAGGFGNNMDTLDQDLFSLIRPKFAR